MAQQQRYLIHRSQSIRLSPAPGTAKPHNTAHLKYTQRAPGNSAHLPPTVVMPSKRNCQTTSILLNEASFINTEPIPEAADNTLASKPSHTPTTNRDQENQPLQHWIRCFTTGFHSAAGAALAPSVSATKKNTSGCHQQLYRALLQNYY